MREKAKRGEYYGIVAVGYRKTRSGQLEKEADIRVQSSLEFIFQKFSEIGSARQLVRWLREEQIKIPRKETISDDGAIVWNLPTQASIAEILKNPVYAGAYTYGRSKRKTVLADGRKRVVTQHFSDPQEWAILIKEHHAGYIS